MELRISLYYAKCFITLFIVSIIWLIIDANIDYFPELPINNGGQHRKEIMQYNGTEDFLLNTTGCFIPNYIKKLKYTKPVIYHRTCVKRAVFVKKITDNVVIFEIDDKLMNKYSKGEKYQCCYRFGSRSTVEGQEDSHITFTECIDFKDKSKLDLRKELISVTCKIQSKKVIYEDVYMIVKKKKIDKRNNGSKRKRWNVLLIGIDNVSRGRAYSTMPKTVEYLKMNNWIDFKGYHKVGSNTFPNLMSFLTGKKSSEIWNTDYEVHRNSFIWNLFKKENYFTAYGEDSIYTPDTFARFNFKDQPTDHYMRPLFLTREDKQGNIVCTKSLPSAKHILDYALNFTVTYKEDGFFGIFWTNSYSHDGEQSPTLIDADIKKFLQELDEEKVMDDTIVFFISDHGMRFGEIRNSIESYYDERLPMLFVWIPDDFKDKFTEQYYNIQVNQNRLVTPYDVYATLNEILHMSTKSDIHKSDACPNCKGLFEEISPLRTCEDVHVDKKWCGCHNMFKVDTHTKMADDIISTAFTNIQEKSKGVRTKKCYKCGPIKLKSVIRLHGYKRDVEESTYYVVAFSVAPTSMVFEATLQVIDSNITVIEPTTAISPYSPAGTCVQNKYDNPLCSCLKKHKC